MAEAAISTLVQLLGNLLIEKVKFLGNVVGEVQRLKEKLEWLQRFLQHGEEKQTTDIMVQKWISDIREVAFDAEDVIQIFILNVENPTKTGGWACFPCRVCHLDRVGREIDCILNRLDDIEKNCAVFGIKDLGPRVDWTLQPNHYEWRRRLNPTQQDTYVVGLEKDVRSLLESAILDDKSKSLSAAIIVGMGGIGKSTLARIVYNHDDVVKRFDLRAWVVVSNEFQPRNVFKDLILELLESRQDRLEEIQHEDASKLQRRLYDRLKGKRYLIVLDDVWEDDHLPCFDNAFPNDDNGSRLLITSGKQLSIKCSTQYTHFMKTLDREKSWNLFMNKALPDNIEDKCPKDLEELGREIVEKCARLPLAINVVGGLLLKEGRSNGGWMKVSKQINSHSGRDDRVVFDILESSYYTLPPRLKPYFLCLSFFKEDATIRVVKLKNIWISLGYIRQEGEERVEAIATRCLEELVSRNLIQVKDISSDGRQIKNCQVHDLIREVSIAKAKEEKGLEILGGKGSSSQPSNKPRALYSPLINGESSRNKHLHSLFFYTDIYTATLSSYWKCFELVKILDLEDCRWLWKLPEAIGGLIGLTYLGLKNTGVSTLPRSIRKLKNLEVIELPSYARLPRSALKLLNLRHIDGECFFIEMPKKISPLKNIRRLKGMVIGQLSFEQKVAQITAMPNLSYLNILMHHNSNQSSFYMKLFNSLNTLENLVRLTLTLFWGHFPVMEGLSTLRHVTQLKLDGEMHRLPTHFPPNVAHLTLAFTGLNEDPMPVLEKLPSLSYLHLGFRVYGGENMVISSDGFSMLEILRFTSMPRLSRIQVGEGAMPELKRVEIQDCDDLDAESLKAQLRPSVVLHVVIRRK